MASVSGVLLRALNVSRNSQLIYSLQASRCRPLRYNSTTATNGKPDEHKNPSESSDSSEAATSQLSENEQKLLEQNKKFEEEVKDFKDKYMRSLAETENVRQRMLKQIEDAKLFGIQGFCKDLLEVADILGTATETVPKEEISKNDHLKNLYEGLTLTESQLQKVFNKNGLEKISPVEGDKFDPFVHEALFEVPTTEKEKGTVAVVQKIGYRLKERTIRPALVGVFKTS